MKVSPEELKKAIEGVGLSLPLVDAAVAGDATNVRFFLSQGANASFAMSLCYEHLKNEKALNLIDCVFWQMFNEGSLPDQLKHLPAKS